MSEQFGKIALQVLATVGLPDESRQATCIMVGVLGVADALADTVGDGLTGAGVFSATGPAVAGDTCTQNSPIPKRAVNKFFMETPTNRLEDHVTIYNMVGQKTACLVVLLNLFSLTASADAFYDALKATGKTDSATVSSVRSSTVDAARRDQMNALTQNNPDYITPSKLAATTKSYSDADLKKMKDDESRQLETDDDRADKLTEAKLKKNAGKEVLPPVVETKPAEPVAPVRGHGPTVQTAKSEGPALKVTNTDPDEVSFSTEDEPVAKSTKKK